MYVAVMENRIDMKKRTIAVDVIDGKIQLVLFNDSDPVPDGIFVYRNPTKIRDEQEKEIPENEKELHEKIVSHQVLLYDSSKGFVQLFPFSELNAFENL